MGQPGAKKTDQIASATPGDVHIIMVPSPGGPVPTPIPHPCSSIINDKVAEKVKVMGQPGAVKGSKSKHTPPHVPMGPGPFQKPPKNEGEIITGSANVFYEGKEAAMFGDTGQMCSDPSDTPVGKVMGTAAMVMVGGGGSGGDAERAEASAAALKAAGAACHKWINANMPPGAEREKAHRSVCQATGHPIDVATGKLFTQNIDLELSGRIPFAFIRNYSSARSDLGAFGRSWRHSYEAQLVVHRDFIAHRDHNGRFLEFEPVIIGGSSFNKLGRCALRRFAEGYTVEHPGGSREFFPWTSPPTDQAVIVPLKEISDRWNNHVTLHYDDLRLSRIEDSAGRTVLLDYNSRGFICALRLVSDPVGRVPQLIKTYAYSDQGDLAEVVDAEGRALRFAYAEHLLVRETDRNGFSFYFAYDRDGWCLETWGDDGILHRRLDYDKSKRATRVTDSLGRSVVYRCNENGVVLKELDHHGFQWSFSYDESLNVVRTTDPVGNTWCQDYDDVGRLIAAENPEGATVEYKWDAQSRPLAYTDPGGKKWVREYDDARRAAREIGPAGEEINEICDEHGDLVRVVHPDRRETRLAYDTAGNLIRITEPSGLSINREHNLCGDLVRESDQMGRRVEIEYDALRRPSRLWRRDKGEVRFERDGEGRITRIIGPDGRAVEYEYTKVGRIKCVVMSAEVRGVDGRSGRPSKRYTYDSENQVTCLETLGGEKTFFEFEGRDRPMRVRFPDGREQTFERNGRGFITKLHENAVLVFEQKSDSFGRVLHRQTGDGVSLAFEYDAMGNLTKASRDDGGGDVKFERDALGRRISEEGPLGCQRLGYRAAHDIDYSWNDELQLSVSSGFSSAGSSWLLARSGRQEIRLQFDLWDRLTRLDFANGERHELGYRADSQPVFRRIVNQQALTEESFEFDSTGWLRDIRVGGAAARHFERDSLSRLVVMVTGSGEGSRKFVWGFDKAGNRVLSTRANGEQLLNRYTKGHRLVTLGEESLNYDARGRVLEQVHRDGTKTLFQWDVGGKLKAIIPPNQEKVEMRYDALGRRVWRSGPQGITRFGWVGNQLVHETRPDGEQRHYLYRPGSFHPLACYIRRPTKDWHLHSFVDDLVGTPLRMTNEKGQTAWEAEFTPWGELMTQTVKDLDQPLRLPGQYSDDESTPNYNYLRYYLPLGATYLSPDPSGVDGGDDSYAYVADPVCWSDPMGLSADDYKVKLGLGLKDKSQGLDYVAWSQGKGFQTYGSLSGRGPFSSQIQEAMSRADEIHFNLKGVDPSKANGKLNDYDEPAGGYTNYELHQIKTNPEYRSKVIWHDENGNEMPKGWMPPGF